MDVCQIPSIFLPADQNNRWHNLSASAREAKYEPTYDHRGQSRRKALGQIVDVQMNFIYRHIRRQNAAAAGKNRTNKPPKTKRTDTRAPPNRSPVQNTDLWAKFQPVIARYSADVRELSGRNERVTGGRAWRTGAIFKKKIGERRGDARLLRIKSRR